MSESRGMRLAATLVFLGLPLAAAGATVWNVLRLAELDAARTQRDAELGPLLARLAREPQPEGPSADAVWVAGDSEALAAATLQSHLVDIVTDASARPIEVQALAVDPEEGGAADAVVMRITYDADNDALVDTLVAVETGLPLLEVAELGVAPAGGDGDAEQPELRVDLTVRGRRDGAP